MTAESPLRPPALASELHVFLVAGEPSGDLLGGRLMAALRQLAPVPIRFAGIGGVRMAAEGLESAFPMQELSLMGLVEVVPHLPRLVRRLRETARAITRSRPAIVVTIDSPGFNLRLARRLRGTAIPVVHYVAPTVWAWRPGRARRLVGRIDHLLAILPFEPPYFTAHGLPCSYVGHPALEDAVLSAVAAARAEKGPAGPPLLCLLPGSRASEASRLLPIYAETALLLRRRWPGLRLALAAVPPLEGMIRAAVGRWPVPVDIAVGPAGKAAIFREATLALAASGTVTIELALAGLPMVAAYRANPLTAAIVRRMIRVPHVTLPNLVLGRGLVPELLQEKCTPEGLAIAAARLLEDPAARAAQLEGLRQAVHRLAVAEAPSMRAAAIVLRCAGREEGADRGS